MAKSNSRRAQKNSNSKISHSVRVGVFGAGGRMGREILSLWHEAFKEPMAVAIGENISKDLAQMILPKLDEKKIEPVDVWIDFSSPQGFKKILNYCQKNNQSLVSGTTGLNKENFKDLKAAAKTLPVLWSPNMSLGVNMLLKALDSLQGTQGFDYQIEEAHHRYKKDKPSGTALLIQEKLQKVINKKAPEPLAIRGGGIFGIHKVWAMSDEEYLVFEHQALSRRVFAKGAIDAALWLYNKTPGAYSMQDLLGTSGE